MDRDSIGWSGYIPAITTPFDEYGNLDLDRLRRLLKWLEGEGMHGLVVAGTTGEWFSLTRQEKAALFHTVGEVLGGRLPLIAGCTAFTAEEALENAVMAAESGFDGILLTPPPYIRPCEREVATYYKDVSKASPLPICVYNWPPGTSIDLTLPMLVELAKLDKVVAIKNSTPVWDHFLKVSEALHDRVRIFGIQADERGAELILNRRADGMMGAGAVLGRAHPGFFDALWAGDKEQALAYGRLDQRIMSEWFNGDFTAKFGSAQAVFKTALNLQGLPGGHPRRPILPLLETEVELMRHTLKSLGRL